MNSRIRGGTEIKADELVRIADALGVDVLEFFPEPTDMLLKVQRFERAGAALAGLSVEQFRASGYSLSFAAPKTPVASEQAWLTDAVEQQLVQDLADLPEVERDVARRMGALLIEYRDRILREERGEG